MEALYLQQLEARRARIARLERSSARLSALRLASAGVAIAILAVGGLAAAPWLLAPALVFAVVAVIHGRVLDRKARAASAAGFFERGLARIRHEWIGTGRTGETYRVADHLFADDLDVFGRGSLFEMLATTRTRAGEETLARWLTTPMTGPVARARQEAVAELAGRIDLRETVAVLGDEVRVAIDAPLLRRWATSPVTLTGSALRLGLALLALTTCTLIVWWVRTGELGTLVALAVLTQGLVARWLQPRVRTVIASVDEPSHDLEVLAGLLRVLERERFTSPHLEALRQSLGAGERASREIARLSQLVAVLASRRNIIFAFTAALLLWATQWAFAIEAWRARAGTHVTHWLDVIGEFEALLALGGFAAEHPDYIYPEIVDGPPVFTATALAHPALGPAAVANTINLDRNGLRLLVVSGSNMSGKSTWLRTIGASLVLAGMGAPVRAAACRVSPMAIGAAIRVQDSLTDGRSRFFAEITRLKQVVDLTRATRGDVLFLLDEILSGTNSHDRRIGADALLRGLVAAGAIGLVTTHDLALADIVGPLAGQADNAHFEDQFVNGTLSFDYTLKPGLVRTSNALALMRSIGLDV